MEQYARQIELEILNSKTKEDKRVVFANWYFHLISIYGLEQTDKWMTRFSEKL